MSKDKEYTFKGTVVKDGRTVEYNWETFTFAPSKKKAMNNLVYRYKRDHDFPKACKVELFGKLEEANGPERA